MSSNLPRGFAIVELLAHHPDGLALHAISERLNLPRSAAHRFMAELVSLGYVRQPHEQGPYKLTLKLVSNALVYLSGSGIVDLAQPMLDQLAQSSGELVRMCVVDADGLVWVAKSQGARSGLRYDPDSGAQVQLFCSANGHAWLANFTDQKALELVAKQGFGKPGEFGPTAPATIQELLTCIHTAREQGYAIVHESFEKGTSAIAAPVRHPGNQQVVACVSIAGPSIRMTPERMTELAPKLLSTANDLSKVSGTIKMMTS
ncbi:IclR family transcriptional regulator [Polaromonas sp.]|uniref:IclR family transcriptional regulator n=1 Tax=Polaromonas sp. TaxID=1869339 RepID=UPI002FC9D640